LRREPAGHGVRLRCPGRVPPDVQPLGAAGAGGRGALHDLPGPAVPAAERPRPADVLGLRLLDRRRAQLRGVGRRADHDRGQRSDLHRVRPGRALPFGPLAPRGSVPEPAPATATGRGSDPQPEVLSRLQLRSGEGTVMRRTYHLALAGAMLAIAACGEERLPSELQGRVYDVRLLAETSPADRIPGGTVAVTETDGVVSEVTVTAARLPAGEYSAYPGDERTGSAGPRVNFTADATGAANVTLGGSGSATTVVIGVGAQGDGALWARFRDLSTGTVSATANLVLGHFDADPTPYPYAVTGTGRVGLWERGEFGSNDFWLGGVVENLSVAPPGFTYIAWLHDAERDIWVSLGPLLNEDRSTATGLDVLPPADQTRRLPKLYLDRLPSAGVDFTHFTHVRLSLERSGA